MTGAAWVYDDGGRADAGFKGEAGDCVVRALTIVMEEDYGVVYRELAADMGALPLSRRERARGVTRRQATPRNGVDRRVYEPWLLARGWVWVPTMSIGSGCTTHLRPEELPSGPLVCRLSKHVCAVIDGVIHDNHDPSRGGTRCVYGWFQPREERR